MSIVLNEYDWTEQMIATKDLGKKPTETLSRVAKYYIENGYGKKEARRLTEVFLCQSDPNIQSIRWSDFLDKIVKNAHKKPLVRLDGVSITRNELAKISELKTVHLRRLAFTLLCVAKYWDAVSPTNNHWVNSPDKEVMEMANIKASIKRQSYLFAQLCEHGMISFSKRVDNLNVQVLFAEEDGEQTLYIHDFRNLGYQYMRFLGGPYYECINCGITEKGNTSHRGRPHKYCPSCAIELHTKQRVDSVTRRRALHEKSVC